MEIWENLNDSRDGIAQIAITLNKILDEIEIARKKHHGHIPEGISGPGDVNRFAVDTLRECEVRSIVPPVELVDLIERLLGSAPFNKRRKRIHFPKLLIAAARVHVETGLSGRKLARELRKRGFEEAADRTIAKYQKLDEFKGRVAALARR